MAVAKPTHHSQRAVQAASQGKADWRRAKAAPAMPWMSPVCACAEHEPQRRLRLHPASPKCVNGRRQCKGWYCARRASGMNRASHLKQPAAPRRNTFPTSSAKSRAVHDSQRVLDQSSASTLTSGIIPISHTRGYRGRSRCGERRTTD